jgi:hypothetical protein
VSIIELSTASNGSMRSNSRSWRLYNASNSGRYRMYTTSEAATIRWPHSAWSGSCEESRLRIVIRLSKSRSRIHKGGILGTLPTTECAKRGLLDVLFKHDIILDSDLYLPPCALSAALVPQRIRFYSKPTAPTGPTRAAASEAHRQRLLGVFPLTKSQLRQMVIMPEGEGG